MKIETYIEARCRGSWRTGEHTPSCARNKRCVKDLRVPLETRTIEANRAHFAKQEEGA